MWPQIAMKGLPFFFCACINNNVSCSLPFNYSRGLQTTACEAIYPACEAILHPTERGPNLVREYIL